jgi:hypothetical protein
MEEAHYSSVKITDSKYGVVDIDEVAEKQTHLSKKERADLLTILQENESLFQGKLGFYPHRKFHIELKPNAIPYYQKEPYLVSREHYNVLKKELD